MLAAFIPVAVFMFAALLLRRLPLLGDVLLLLYLPTAFASFLVQAHLVASTSSSAARPARAKDTRTMFVQTGRNLRHTLFGAWYQPANIFPLLVVGIVLVILGLVAYALLSAVGGQAVVSLYGFFELPAMHMIRLLLAYGVAALFWVVVTLLLFWTLPLLVLRDVTLVEALGLNVRALQHNVAALAVYLLVLASGLVPLVAVRLWSPFAGFLALWLGGAVLVTLFGFSAYCSFRLVYADAESAPRPAAGAPRRSQP
jgi:hypothetical protein